MSLNVAKVLRDTRTITCTWRSGCLLFKAGSMIPSAKFRNFSSTFVPHPKMCSKEKLMKCLKGIRGDVTAKRFCGLLLEANLIMGHAKTTCKRSSWREYKTDKIVDELRKTISENKAGSIIAERLVDGIYALLPGDFSNKAVELLPSLTEIENSKSWSQKYEKSEDYLQQLMKTLESHFIASIEKSDLFPRFSSEDSLHNLETLQTFLNHSVKSKADCLLHIVFDVNRDGFSDEEKREIGNLMMDAIESIETCIKEISLSPNTICSVFQKRSSLQFLVDDYARFPAKDEALLVEFYMGRINDSIKVLDNFITRLCKAEKNRWRLDETETDGEVKFYMKYCRDEEELGLEKAGATNLPESHTWWQIYSKDILRDSDERDRVDEMEVDDAFFSSASEASSSSEAEEEKDSKETKDVESKQETDGEKDIKVVAKEEVKQETEDGMDRKSKKRKSDEIV